ncbi:MAG: hypothetical protein WCG87_08500 [Bacteroidota bacterium]
MKKSARIIIITRWIARILAILIAGFILLMFVGESLESHGPSTPISTKNIFLLTIFFFAWLGLVLSWKYEWIGSLITIIGIATMSVIMAISYIMNGIAPFPKALVLSWICIPSILFLICRHYDRKLLVRNDP